MLRGARIVEYGVGKPCPRRRRRAVTRGPYYSRRQVAGGSSRLRS